MKRYTLVIVFNKELNEKVDNISEEFTTLREAKKIAKIIDHTVKIAYIEDRVTLKLISLKPI